MKFSYGERGAGDQFLSPDDLFPHPAVMNFVLAYGQDGLEALPEASDQIQQLIEQMVQAGLMDRDEGGQLRLTPRMVRGMQHRALLEIFAGLDAGLRDVHPTVTPGRGVERADGTKPYQFGDSLSELDIGGTLRRAAQREAQERADRRADAPPAVQAPPHAGQIHLRESDFEVFNVEGAGEAAICVLIDASGSMARYGRHIAAKRVAMGLRALVRERFPQDTLDFISFASTAEVVSERDLPLLMPRPITTREWQIRIRVPLDQASLTHPHFTNLHHGLRLARSTLARRGAANKQIFIITDGQPTAHLSGGIDAGGDILNLIYPPSPTSAQATLAEALRCRRSGIRLSTFALIEEYEGMDWVGFVEQLTRVARGVSFYCTAGDLEGMIIESYLSGKRKRATRP